MTENGLVITYEVARLFVKAVNGGREYHVIQTVDADGDLKDYLEVFNHQKKKGTAWFCAHRGIMSAYGSTHHAYVRDGYLVFADMNGRKLARFEVD